MTRNISSIYLYWWASSTMFISNIIVFCRDFGYKMDRQGFGRDTVCSNILKQSFLCFLKYREIIGQVALDFFLFIERKLILHIRTDYRTLKCFNLAISNLYNVFENSNMVIFDSKIDYFMPTKNLKWVDYI